jgi:hypothetical protein
MVRIPRKLENLPDDASFVSACYDQTEFARNLKNHEVHNFFINAYTRHAQQRTAADHFFRRIDEFRP